VFTLMPSATSQHRLSTAVTQLVVLAYVDEHRAAEVLATLQRLRTGSIVDTEDAVCVVRGTDWNVKLHHGAHLGDCDEASRRFWRTLISCLVLAPGASGPRVSVQDYGIAPAFERDLAAALPPGSSAVFMTVPQRTLTRIVPELRGFGGTLLQTPIERTTHERKTL
jgi:uncharacterized membrane protein